MDERPTMEERYIKATKTSRLDLSLLRAGDLDVVIAAGWVREDEFGVRLLRLRSEFDAVNRIELQQAADSLTARVLTLMQLRSLEPVKRQLGALALRRALKDKFPPRKNWSEVVLKIAGRSLDAWLDPNCHVCSGRGKIGRHGMPQTICTKCDGGTRRVRFDKSDEGHRLGRTLMTEMDSAVDRVCGELARYLKQRGPTT